MEINLTKDSFVDQRTGEIEAPSEFLAKLVALEGEMRTSDEQIKRLKGELQHAKDILADQITQLRAMVRSREVRPLLELSEQAGDADDDIENWDETP